MSQQLISRSPDLKRLRDDGYNIEIKFGHLVVNDVPYVNDKKEVKIGTLVSALELAGDVTFPPTQHVALFAGEYPCDHTGAPLERIRHQSQDQVLGDGLTVNHSFSSKPLSGRYVDYHDKMTTYAAIFWSEACQINPEAKVRTYKVVPSDEPHSVFRYIDTASSRAQINAVTAKLELGKVAIVGLGGTGSYVLDLVAKTPVKGIHLFDGDILLQHNAFRAPGAPSIQELEAQPKKVKYWAEKYSAMRDGIVPHDYAIDASNVDQLRETQFVFLCMVGGETKQRITNELAGWDIPFIDVGMGVELVDGSLRGIVRVTTSSREKRDHFKDRVSFAEAGSDEYDRNIQIADLNALNASLAVIKWKKLFGFYFDFVHENHSTYAIDSNQLVDGDFT